MNWMREILGFYDLIMLNQLSTGQIALWHALMYINNKCSWNKWFSVSNQTLELYTGLERTTIFRSRNKLKQLNLIDFKANGTKATSYKLISCCTVQQDTQQETPQITNTRCTVQQETQQETQQVTQQETQRVTHTLNKQKETKQKETKKVSKKEKISDYNSIILENFQDEKLIATVYEFIKMRKLIKAPLTNRALELLIRKLKSMSNSDSERIAILEQSIGNSWKGVFELKGEIKIRQQTHDYNYGESFV